MHRKFCTNAKVNSFFMGWFVAKWNQNVLAYYFTLLYFCKKLNSVLDSAEGSKDNMVWNRRYE